MINKSGRFSAVCDECASHQLLDVGWDAFDEGVVLVRVAVRGVQQQLDDAQRHGLVQDIAQVARCGRSGCGSFLRVPPERSCIRELNKRALNRILRWRPMANPSSL